MLKYERTKEMKSIKINSGLYDQLKKMVETYPKIGLGALIETILEMGLEIAQQDIEEVKRRFFEDEMVYKINIVKIVFEYNKTEGKIILDRREEFVVSQEENR
jgi:hypothetical protein